MKKLVLMFFLVFLFSCGNSNDSIVTPSSSSSSSSLVSSENSSDNSSNSSDVSSESSSDNSSNSSDVSSESSSDNSSNSSEVSSESSSDNSSNSSEVSSESSSDNSSNSSEVSSESSSSSSSESLIPDSFTKRVVIEEVTGTWCGYCPDGLQRIRETQDLYGKDKVLAVAIHYSDALSCSDGNSLVSKLGGVSGVPAGAVDRVEKDGSVFMMRSYWKSLAGTELNKSINCGLKLDATNQDTLVVVVGANSNSDNSVKLTVMVLENKILMDQHSYMNNNSSSDYYQQGDILKDFEHNHVLRKILGDNILGQSIVLNKDGVVVKKYAMDLSTVSNKENVTFIGILSNSNNEIITASEVNIGEKSDW